MSSIFGLGAASGTLSWESYQRWAAHPAVKWTIPMSLGDSYYGYRVVGTTEAFLEHYRFRNDGRPTLALGSFARTDRDVVLGSEVAERRGLTVGDEIALTHGLRGTGILDHEEHPFRISGILAPTYTPIDRSLYTTLEGIEAMHSGWENGVPPSSAMPTLVMPGADPPPGVANTPTSPDDSDAAADTTSHEPVLTAFLLGTKNRFESLRLQREINTDLQEPLTAILPAVSLTELWHSIGYAEDGARIIAGAVLLVGLMGMLVALYSTLEERRREMAILRSLGAGPRRIAALLVFESGVLSVAGALLGVGLTYLVLFVGGGMAERHFGIAIPLTAPGRLEWIYLAGVVVAGLVVGLIPAWRAYRSALQDGLAIRL